MPNHMGGRCLQGVEGEAKAPLMGKANRRLLTALGLLAKVMFFRHPAARSIGS
ncbi:MAG TPA: hypothetical protein VMS09_13160 [Paenibacillus sp.]|uniref:hypothetical protein n=1 Tax=Paenibacillus sp. TaxID=58172 RepID=UPI0028D2215D|nr:hypothetical protein [Paenibacillus sp.]HUC92951.1 hypothetical protein [Paenibacillus sp.]